MTGKKAKLEPIILADRRTKFGRFMSVTNTDAIFCSPGNPRSLYKAVEKYARQGRTSFEIFCEHEGKIHCLNITGVSNPISVSDVMKKVRGYDDR